MADKKIEWKKCPKCDGWIQKNFTYHVKCGWGEPSENSENHTDNRIEATKELMQICFDDAMEIRNNLKKKYKDLDIEQIDWGAVSVSLFINRTGGRRRF